MKAAYHFGGKRPLIIMGAFALLGGGFFAGVHMDKKRGIYPFVKKNQVWSIGIYAGSDISELHPLPNNRNPVLSAKDVTDVSAEFVADPFMIEHEGKWYMFFEVLNRLNNQGNIGLATSSDCLHWEYMQIVLKEPFHLSYPYVFKWQDEFYMIQQARLGFSIVLYKAVDFPTKWSFYKEIIYGKYADPSIVRYDGKWWLFASDDPFWDNLHLFYADDLTGPWIAHPKSPVIVRNRAISRPAGRVLTLDDGHIVRFAQDCSRVYGSQVRAFEITELSTQDYKEKEMSASPILKGSGSGWNAKGMHQIDAHRNDEFGWIACVDGWEQKWTFDLEY